MILVLCTLPPPHAKGYVWLMTCLPHVLHCKPDSDRHLTIFPGECSVFYHMHPSSFLRSYLLLQGVSWPPILVADCLDSNFGDFAVFVLKTLLHLGRCQYCLHPLWIPEFYVIVSTKSINLYHHYLIFFVNAVFHISIRVCQTPTHGVYVGRKHRRSFFTFSHV